MGGESWKREIHDVTFGEDVRVGVFVNLYGCEIGDGTSIGPFVEIQKGAVVGKRCKVQSHTFICEGVTIEDDVFIGHSVTFTNDRHPRVNANGEGWLLERTRVGAGASIGSGATILPGVTIGAEAMIGAGAVVTKDVEPCVVAAGNPARPIV